MALEQDCLLDLWKIQMSFHRSVCGIIGKRSETIVISFHAVTFIIIILVFRHAKFTPPFNATAICTEASKYAVAYLLFFSLFLLPFLFWKHQALSDGWYVALMLGDARHHGCESCGYHSEVALPPLIHLSALTAKQVVPHTQQCEFIQWSGTETASAHC